MKLNCYSYQLPFKQPLTTSNKVYHQRSGLVFHLQASRFQCFAEAAPLPGFSPETLDDIWELSQKNSSDWLQRLERNHPIQQLQEYYQEQNIPPSLQFALDTLAYQVEARQAEQSLQSFLVQQENSKIAVNGLVTLTDDNLLQTIRILQDHGFETVKCKIGSNFDQEYHMLTQIRGQFPELRIRLDANRAWPVDKAIARLSILESLNIEYCEEPLRHPTPENYRKLTQQMTVPLALDESVNKKEGWQSLLAYCQTLIVKPMVIGSLSRLFDIRQYAQRADARLVFTSSLESGIGRTITAMLAAKLGTSDLAHGLNTGQLFGQDVLPGQPEITSGYIYLDPRSELLTPDLNHLKDISTKLF